MLLEVVQDGGYADTYYSARITEGDHTYTATANTERAAIRQALRVRRRKARHARRYH